MKRKLSASAIVVICILSISIAFLVATIIATTIDVEWWVVNVSRPMRAAFTTVSNLLPFSWTEILIYLAIIIAVAIVVAIIVLAAKKKGILALKLIAITLATVILLVSLYSVTATAEYKRVSLSGEWQDAYVEKEEFLQIAKDYQKEYNRLADSFARDEKGNIIEELSFDEIALLVKSEVEKYADGNYYASTVSTPKEVLSSNLMSYLGISGMYLSLTGEANVNTVTYYTDLPTTIAHELAHSLQIMREDEASVFAFYVCLGSSNPLLRYSGLQYGYGQLLNGVRKLYGTDSPEYTALIDGMSKYCQIDRNNTNNVWDKYQGFINDVSDFFNDIYLKLSGESQGIKSYILGGANVSEAIPVNPDGTPIVGADPILIIEYSTIQKMFIYKSTN